MERTLFIDYIKISRHPLIKDLKTTDLSKEIDRERLRKFKSGKGCLYIQKALSMMFFGENALKKEKSLAPDDEPRSVASSIVYSDVENLHTGNYGSFDDDGSSIEVDRRVSKAQSRRR